MNVHVFWDWTASTESIHNAHVLNKHLLVLSAQSKIFIYTRAEIFTFLSLTIRSYLQLSQNFFQIASWWKNQLMKMISVKATWWPSLRVIVHTNDRRLSIPRQSLCVPSNSNHTVMRGKYLNLVFIYTSLFWLIKICSAIVLSATRA